MQFDIREIELGEYDVLDDFLYEAIFIPKGVKKPPMIRLRWRFLCMKNIEVKESEEN